MMLMCANRELFEVSPVFINGGQTVNEVVSLDGFGSGRTRNIELLSPRPRLQDELV